MRTRLFLRTTEFLWQEGHTAHATEAEAKAETDQMLKVYAEFAEKFMAMPVIMGEKTASERFPGAVSTYSIEAMMQDRKALQSGTSHFLGQNFSKASGIKFLDQGGTETFAWTTSWGVSTRLIGGLIMTHADDDGLILPPRLAPAQVVILPILHKEETRAQVLEYCRKIAAELKALRYHDAPLAVELDEREGRGGEKVWGWIKKGVPVRIEIGPRDMAADSVALARRDKPHKEITFLKRAELAGALTGILDDIQASLLKRAADLRASNTRKIDSKEEFYAFFTPKNREQPEIHGGFALSHWSGEPDVEETLKNDLGVTIRCIPRDAPAEEGKCVISGKPSSRRVIFAKAY
jgi:prolyl-tRNA synthetase